MMRGGDEGKGIFDSKVGRRWRMGISSAAAKGSGQVM